MNWGAGLRRLPRGIGPAAGTWARRPYGRPALPAGRPSVIKRILPRTLLGRSFLIIVMPLVLLQVISTWVFYDRHYDTTTKRLSQALAGEIAIVIDMLERTPDPTRRAQIFFLARRTMRLDLTLIENRQISGMASVFSGGPFASILERKLTTALKETVGRPFLIDTRSLEDDVQIQVQLDGSVLSVLVPRERLFSSTTYIFIMWMVGSSIVLFAVAMIFMRNQVKPIRRLAHAAESFGKGRDVADFKPEGATEVRQAAAAFLQMRRRIKRQIDQRTEFLAGVSHDLRTPLTRMKLQLAMLGDGPEVENLASDVTEMQQMVEGYLAFVRGEGTEQPQTTDLAALLEDIALQMRRAGSIVRLDTDPAIVLDVRREALRRCLANLIGNAARHARTVSVNARARERTVEIVIDDDGPGIPEDSREAVFRPFHRIDAARGPDTGGVGLGLTIARDVVRNHGGELTLEDSPMGGLRARLWLPL